MGFRGHQKTTHTWRRRASLRHEVVTHAVPPNRAARIALLSRRAFGTELARRSRAGLLESVVAQAVEPPRTEEA